MPMKNFWILGMVIVVFGCKTSTALPQVDASTFSGYQEDLSTRLPDFPDYAKALQKLNTSLPASSQSVDAQLADRMRNGYEKTKGEPYFSGFTVLVYSGVDRNEAFKTRDNLALFFPEVKTEMQYQQPRYLVKVGRYGYKIEAQPVFYKLKTQFPTARIIQDRFLRKEYTPPPATESSNAQGKN
jgi:hypothetical protein